jgi:hypothetical protein
LEATVHLNPLRNIAPWLPWHGIWPSRVPWYPETGNKTARGNTAEEKGIDWKVSPEKIGSFRLFITVPLAAI